MPQRIDLNHIQSGRHRTTPQPTGEVKLNRSKFGGKRLPHIFPDDLDDQHYMTFRVMKSVRKKALDRTVESTDSVIILPVPGNLALNYTADYENAELGMLGALTGGELNFDQMKQGATAAAGDLMSAGQDMISTLKGGKISGGMAALGTIAAATAASAFFGGGLGAGAAGGIGIAKAIKGAGKKAGIASNPHMAVLFKGIGFKDHSFSFKFIPRNAKEADQIQQIYTLFKNHMLPSYAYNKMAFNYPDEFRIGFAPHIQKHLYSIGNCVLKSCNITYNSSGVPSFSHSGAPMEVDIALSFQEVKIETRQQSAEERVSDVAAMKRAESKAQKVEEARLQQEADARLDKEHMELN